jgi:hypothetical protein
VPIWVERGGRGGGGHQAARARERHGPSSMLRATSRLSQEDRVSCHLLATFTACGCCGVAAGALGHSRCAGVQHAQLGAGGGGLLTWSTSIWAAASALVCPIASGLHPEGVLVYAGYVTRYGPCGA